MQNINFSLKIINLFLLIFEHRKSCLVVSSLLLFRRHFFYFGGGGGMLDDDRGAKIDGAGCVEAVVLAVEAVVGWAAGGGSCDRLAPMEPPESS